MLEGERKKGEKERKEDSLFGFPQVGRQLMVSVLHLTPFCIP
jgi:hypothetical protein